MPEPETHLVTGAAGFIGSHLVERLLARGDRVIGVDNFDPFYSPDEKRRNLAAALEHPAFRLIEADCADLDALERAVARIGWTDAANAVVADDEGAAHAAGSGNAAPTAGSGNATDTAGSGNAAHAADSGNATHAAGSRNATHATNPTLAPAPALSTIVHLAAKAGVRPSIADPMGYAHANLTGTQSLLELARRLGVKRFVFASSSSVYGNNEKVPFSEDDPVERPISPYAATKRAGELICHTYHHLFGIGVIALRFFTVYGPRQRPDLAIRKFTNLLLRGEPIPFYGDGTTERDYTWIDDILDGVVAAIDRTARRPGEYHIVNLGESRTTTLARLVSLIGDALGIEPALERLPMQPGDVRRTFADVSRARELLGYRPTTPVEDGIPRFVTWMREAFEREAAHAGRA